MSAKGTSKWDHDAIMAIALGFSTRAEFHKGAVAAYAAARRSGEGLDHFCSHMQKINERWTDEKIHRAALEHTTKQSFRENNLAAYTACMRSDRRSEFLAHMTRSGVASPRYIYAILAGDRSAGYVGLSKHPRRRYRDHAAHGRDCVRALIRERHDFLIIGGPYDEDIAPRKEREAIAQMLDSGVRLLNANRGGVLGAFTRKDWTYESVKDEAKKYKTREDFKKNSGSAYRAASRLGGISQFCQHMPSKRPIKWTPDTIRREALKYATRRQFEKACGRAVHVARKLGIMEEVCSHMEWKARRPKPDNDSAPAASHFDEVAA